MTEWFLLPEGKTYRDFLIVRREKATPEKVEAVNPVTQYLSADSRIIAFKLLALDPSYEYDVSWNYK
jgi:hypothetical protein